VVERRFYPSGRLDGGGCRRVDGISTRSTFPIYFKLEHIEIASYDPDHEIGEPAILLIGPERREPHLPVQARLVGRHRERASRKIAGLVFELVSLPGLAVVAALHHNIDAGT